MKYDIDKNEYGFDTAISASDWKYSAAITGLLYYFKELEKKYEIKTLTIDEITDNFLLYITASRPSELTYNRNFSPLASLGFSR